MQQNDKHYPIKKLEVTSAYRKTFGSGNQGWFGKAVDPVTGQRFQIIGAVEIPSIPATHESEVENGDGQTTGNNG